MLQPRHRPIGERRKVRTTAMPPETNPTKAAVEAAVLDLTDEEIVEALRRIKGNAVREAYEDREAYAWPTEARRNVLDALARRLGTGRVPLKS
jgi:hypothetical protein